MHFKVEVEGATFSDFARALRGLLLWVRECEASELAPPIARPVVEVDSQREVGTIEVTP